MNKLVLTLATVATFGLSTASTQERVQAAPSQASIAHKVRASHRAGAKKAVVVRHRTLHRGVSHARHYQKVVVKHMPANRT
jgi:Ni/Co efflux regulator RcnB